MRLWLNGETCEKIAELAGIEGDEFLGVLARVVSFTLQTLVERLPDALRFGLLLPQAIALAVGGCGTDMRPAHLAPLPITPSGPTCG